MDVIIAAILTAVPLALFAIAGKVFTQSMVQTVLEKIIIFSLNRFVKLTTNEMDDQIAAEIVARIEGTKK